MENPNDTLVLLLIGTGVVGILAWLVFVSMFSILDYMVDRHHIDYERRLKALEEARDEDEPA